ncbi:MAG: hypothetical protein KDA99_28815, partial [Planctomycetales bacterium]|nr:hypothetical protein [Planctomycetales bacterium]
MIVIVAFVIAVRRAFTVPHATEFGALAHPQMRIIPLAGHEVLRFALDRLGGSGLGEEIGSAGSQANAQKQT